jgi:hypothetical protein
MPQLASELTIHLHQVQPARRDVAGVERDVAQAEELLGPEAAPAPYAEDVSCPMPGHVLDGDADVVGPAFF